MMSRAFIAEKRRTTRVSVSCLSLSLPLFRSPDISFCLVILSVAFLCRASFSRSTYRGRERSVNERIRRMRSEKREGKKEGTTSDDQRHSERRQAHTENLGDTASDTSEKREENCSECHEQSETWISATESHWKTVSLSLSLSV